MADHAGPRDRGDDVGRTADRGAIAEDRREALDAVDTILQRDHPRVGAEERARLFARSLGIPQLDREQHQIHRSHLARIIGDVDVFEVQVAQRALDR